MSGYQIISLRDTPFVTGGATMMLDGIYDQIESNNRKPILLDGIVIDGIEKNAVYTQVTVDGSNFVFNVYGKIITITDTDAVSVTEPVDDSVGDDTGAGDDTDGGDGTDDI